MHNLETLTIADAPVSIAQDTDTPDQPGVWKFKVGHGIWSLDYPTRELALVAAATEAGAFAAGPWEVSYGEIWTGGDLAIVSAQGEIVATIATHDAEVGEHDVADAELLARAPIMLDLLTRLAAANHPLDVEELRAAANSLVSEVYREILPGITAGSTAP